MGLVRPPPQGKRKKKKKVLGLTLRGGRTTLRPNVGGQATPEALGGDFDYFHFALWGWPKHSTPLSFHFFFQFLSIFFKFFKALNFFIIIIFN
jgi:hypothetical protein